MFRHTYPQLAAIITGWRWLLWPTLAGLNLKLAHLNAAKLGMGSTPHCEKRAPRKQSSIPLALTPHGALEKLHFMPFRCLVSWR